MAVAALGFTGRIVVTEDYIANDDKAPFHDAIASFLNLEASTLRDASADLLAYYSDTVRQDLDSGWDAGLPKIQQVDSVWDFVDIGHEFHVEREWRKPQVYVSIECECDWEIEHGLQLVFRGGRVLSKVGPCDGHLTNASAVGRADLADVVYASPFAL